MAVDNGKEEKPKDPPPLLFTRLVAHHPWLVMFLCLAVTATTLGLSASRPLMINTGFYGAFSISGHPTGDNEEKLDVAVAALLAPEADDTQTQQSKSAGYLMIVYEAPDGNLFQEKHIVRMRTLEAKIRALPNFAKYCLKSGGDCLPHRTVLNYFYPTVINMTSYLIYAPNGEGDALRAIPDVVDYLDAQYEDENVRYFLDNSFRVTKKSKYTRTIFALGGPLENYKNTEDQKFAQRKLAEKFATNEILPLLETARTEYKGDGTLLKNYWAGTGVSQQHILDLIFGDVPFLSLSVGFVFLYILFHTRSFYLSALGIFHVLQAFPLTYFVLTWILGYVYLGMLDLLSFFMIIGIGADDIFVMVDAFKQSKLRENNGLIARMDWTFRRAAKAMLVTSATTAGAFIANAVSPIPLIREFGLFSAVLVVFNYLLVITWYPAVIITWEKRRMKREAEGKDGRFPACCQACAKSSRSKTVPQTIIVTPRNRDVEMATMGDTAAAPSSIPSLPAPPDPVQPPGLVESALPDQDELEASMDATAVRMPSGSTDNRLQRTVSFASQHSVDAQSHKFRMFERFAYYKLSPVIYKGRFYILVFFVGAVIASAVYAAQLTPSSEDSNFLPRDHGFMRLNDIQMEEFGAESMYATVDVVWGIRGVDKSEVDPMDIEDKGKPLWDDEFDPTSAAAQQSLYDTCTLMLAEAPLWLRPDYFHCIMADFRDWSIAKKNVSFPVPTADFTSLLREFHSGNENHTNSLGWSASNQLRFMRVQFNATVSRRASWMIREPHYNHWETFLANRNADTNTPIGAKRAFQSSHTWTDMATDRVLVLMGYVGVMASVVVAFILLVASTGNLIVGSVATLAIAGVVLVVGGCMVGLGWQIGVTESMCMTVLVGMSVDYSVHMAAAYTHNHEKRRYDRMRRGLLELGVSIFGAGVTTMGCSLLMLLTRITFLYQFGMFLSFTIAISLVFAFLPFPAALMIVGPEYPSEKGNLSHFLHWGRFCPAEADPLSPTWRPKVHPSPVVPDKGGGGHESPQPLTLSPRPHPPLRKSRSSYYEGL